MAAARARGSLYLLLLLVVAWLGFPPVARAIPSATDAAKHGIQKYKEGEYEDALNALKIAVAQPDELSELQRAQVYAYMAFCEVAYSRRDSAKELFRNALELNPSMSLDDPDISPKIREVFLEAKQEIQQGTRTNPDPVPAFTGRVPAHSRLTAIDAGWRSALLPGWGQFATQRPAAGTMMTGGALVAGGALVYTQLNVNKARRYYDDAASPGQKQEEYDQLVRFSGYRNIALGAVAVVWSGAVVEAYLGRKRTMDLQSRQMHVTPIVTEDSVGVGVSARF